MRWILCLGAMIGAALVLVAAPAFALPKPTGGGEPSIALGQPVSGDLRQGDATLPTGEFSDGYSFEARAGQHVVISLQSSAFDPYVMIRGPNGFQQDNDDDAHGGLNSRLDVTLPAAGTYHVFATSYAAGNAGAYTLRVDDAANAPQPVANLNDGNGAPLLPGHPQSGSLQAGDATLRTGEFVDSYRFLGHRGQHVIIDLQSSAFDPYLIVTAPSGHQEDNDDAAQGNNNSRLDMVLSEDGEYGVHATSYQAGEHGAYSLNITLAGEGDRVVAAAPSGGATLTLGGTVQGQLQSGDETLQSGEFSDTYRFTGQRGQHVAFDMTSSSIDSYLIVIAPSGQQHDNDDASANVHDSHLDLTLSEAGTYRVVATSYAAHETGAYTLRASSGSGVVVSTAPTHPTGTGRVQVHAIIVGISDYSGFANNLEYTADDATNLAQTLRQEGVLSADSVVLTDAQATRANVRAAFQRVAAHAGPNDLFLFFFSGHGSQSAEIPTSHEADRREEYIVLRDGLVQDDEVAQWFNAVHARVGIIALDSCFSGGFARDVVNRPGIMGLFSSEEDLTSAVADKFQAGGYLSHFLRTGLAGAADSDHNLSITAGELSTYLWREFATEVEDVQSETTDHETSYQRLVVDRGGVKIDDLVLALH